MGGREFFQLQMAICSRSRARSRAQIPMGRRSSSSLGRCDSCSRACRVRRHRENAVRPSNARTIPRPRRCRYGISPILQRRESILRAMDAPPRAALVQSRALTIAIPASSRSGGVGPSCDLRNRRKERSSRWEDFRTHWQSRPDYFAGRARPPTPPTWRKISACGRQK